MSSSRRSTVSSLAVRFPCGHLEAQLAVIARTRVTPGAIWVACHRCNLIVLTIARPRRGASVGRPPLARLAEMMSSIPDGPGNRPPAATRADGPAADDGL